MSDSAPMDQGTLLKLVRGVERACNAAESAERTCNEIKQVLGNRLDNHGGRLRELEKGQVQTRTIGTVLLLLLGIAQAFFLSWVKWR